MKGYEKLKATVIDDCNKGEGCFNHNGCDKERTTCFHRYCDKFKWIVNRAKHYGEVRFKLGRYS